MAAPGPTVTPRQTLERDLQLAKAFLVERVDAQSTAQMEFARMDRPQRPEGNNEFELRLYNNRIEEYNNVKNEMERKIRSAEQARATVSDLERQIDELSERENPSQPLVPPVDEENEIPETNPIDIHEGPLIQELGSSSESADEEPNYFVETDSEDSVRNQHGLLREQISRRHNSRITATSGPVTVTGAVAILPVNAMVPLEWNRQVPQIDAVNINDLALVSYNPQNDDENRLLPPANPQAVEQPVELPVEQPPGEPGQEQIGDSEDQQSQRNAFQALFREHDVKKHTWSTYADYWNDVPTTFWRNQSQNYLVQRCRETTLDYQRFENEEQFARLEEFLAQTLFGVNEEQAERAMRTNNFLTSFNNAQRIIVRNVRQKLEKIGGNRNLELQAIPFVIRNDRDIRKRWLASQMGYVFRVKCQENSRKFKFVDGEARTYKSWKNFITTNNLPKAMMCYISDGFLRRQQAPNPQREVAINFCETPACSLVRRTKEKVGTAVKWLSPLATVAFFWNPVGWIGIGLDVAMGFVMSYAAIGQVCSIYDKATHDESYAVNIFHLISTLATVVIQKALPLYLKSVAKAHRVLTKLESTIITAFLRGMSVSQVVSFVGILYTFCTKPKITSLDALNLVVACQNIYCCWISPKSAKAMLDQVRGELADEQYRKLTEDQAKEEQLKSEIKELERQSLRETVPAKLEELQEEINERKQSLDKCVIDHKLHQSEFQSYKSEPLEQFRRKEIEMTDLQKKIEELKAQLKTLPKGSEEAVSKKNDIQTKQLELINGQGEMLSFQQKHQQEFKDSMKNDGAKKKYQEFLDDETKNLSTNIEIDQNGRIIQVMFEMDAQMVFTKASDTQSTIRFSNGETLDLNINNQFDIHPRAINQLNRISTTGGNVHNTKADLDNVFSKTKKFNEGKMDKMEYLAQIRETLSPYGMISKAEISAVSDQMKHLKGTPGWLRFFQSSRFDNLPPAEALRLRNTIESIRSSDKTAVFKAAELLAGKLGYSNTNRLADCMKIVDQTIHDKMALFEQQRTQGSGTEVKNLKNICQEIFNPTSKEISQLQKENFSKAAVESLATQQLMQTGHSDALAANVENKLKDVEKNYFGENSTLAFCHPLSGVCHEMEYATKTSKTSKNVSQVERDNANVTNFIKNRIFGKDATLVSQDGLTVRRTWKRTDGYFKQKTTSYATRDDLNPQSHLGEASAYVFKILIHQEPTQESLTTFDLPSSSRSADNSTPPRSSTPVEN